MAARERAALGAARCSSSQASAPEPHAVDYYRLLREHYELRPSFFIVDYSGNPRALADRSPAGLTGFRTTRKRIRVASSPTIPEVYHRLLRRDGRARSTSASLVLCAVVARPLDSADLVAADRRSALVIMLESDAADLATPAWPVTPAQATDELAGLMRVAERLARRSRSNGTPAQEALAEILLWLPISWRFPVLEVLAAHREALRPLGRYPAVRGTLLHPAQIDVIDPTDHA